MSFGSSHLGFSIDTEKKTYLVKEKTTQGTFQTCLLSNGFEIYAQRWWPSDHKKHIL
jgi:hypothetical protein